MSMFTALRQPITQVLRVKFDFAANTAAGTTIIGDITTDPAQPAVKFISIPATEVWHVTDIYAEDSADIGVDGYLDFLINELKQNIRFGPMGQTLKSLLNPLRLRQAVIVDRNSKLQFTFTNRTAVGASPASTTITVEVVRVPVG